MSHAKKLAWASRFYNELIVEQTIVIHRETGSVFWSHRAKVEPSLHADTMLSEVRVAPGGKRLAIVERQLTDTNKEKVTITFWDLPLRQWHHWTAALVAIITTLIVWRNDWRG